MIVSCPECAARFEVGPTALGPAGRKLRCGKCAHVWMQPAPALPPPRRGRWRAALAAAAGAATVIVLAAAGGAVFRGEIVERWPAAVKLYAAVGFAPAAPDGGRGSE